MALCGCGGHKYQFEILPQPGMNRGIMDAVRLDLVWTTPETESALSEIEAKDWFGQRKSTEYRDVVLTQSVSPGDKSAAFPNTKGWVKPPAGCDATGFIIFAFYEEPGEKPGDLRFDSKRASTLLKKYARFKLMLKETSIELKGGKAKKLWGLIR